MWQAPELDDYTVIDIYIYSVVGIAPFFTHGWDILEYNNIWWCACELYSKRVGFAASFQEESLQWCEAGDLQESHCYWWDAEIYFVSQYKGTNVFWLLVLSYDFN